MRWQKKDQSQIQTTTNSVFSPFSHLIRFLYATKHLFATYLTLIGALVLLSQSAAMSPPLPLRVVATTMEHSRRSSAAHRCFSLIARWRCANADDNSAQVIRPHDAVKKIIITTSANAGMMEINDPSHVSRNVTQSMTQVDQEVQDGLTEEDTNVLTPI